MRLEGDVRLTLCARVEAFLDSVFTHPFKSIIVDLNGAEGVDSTTLGLLAKLAIRSRGELGIQPTLFSSKPDLTRVVRSMGLDRVFTIVESPSDADLASAAELPDVDADDELIRQQIIEAHETLMRIDARNVSAFKDLVQALQAG